MFQSIDEEPAIPTAAIAYDLRLCPWDSMSCWIDAAIETFWHVIIPSLLPYGIMEDEDVIGNDFDITLLRMYQLSTYSFEGRIAASKSMREYVWSNFGESRRKGDQADVISFMYELLQKASPAFKSFFAINRFTAYYCNDAQRCNHISTCDNSRIRPKLFLIDWSFSDIKNYGLIDSYNRFCEALQRRISGEDVQRVCKRCSGPCTRSTIRVGPMPMFLLIQDPTSHLGDSAHPDIKMFFPYQFTMPDSGATYILQAIICSTQREGSHYKTVATIRKGNATFVAKIDNMKPSMTVLLDVDDFNDAAAADVYRLVQYPKVLVYKKLILRHVFLSELKYDGDEGSNFGDESTYIFNDME